jgi:hypothetical protein
MQTFIDATTQQVYAFDPDVKVLDTDGVYSFETVLGAPLNVPATLQPYVVPAPTAALVAAQALAASVQAAFAAGLTITSTSTPAVNGTYPLDALTQIALGQIEVFIEKNNAFPGSSGTSLVRYDAAGVGHIFPSVAVFSEFATAVANYVVDLDLYAAGAAGASLPASSVTIA